jgi:branched-chain amino acid transport system ATP-binding protein
MNGSRLSVDGLVKRFGGLIAVNNVTLQIAEGECLGLIGPNGAGKSTVFALMAGELEADAGRISLNGREVTRLPVYQRARLGVARTYQRLEVFPEMTVLEHLLVAQSAHRGSTGVLRDLVGRGKPTADEIGRAHSVLERVGLADRASIVVGTLSLGACRLVELARALVTSPNVLLADEPSSGLDTYETAEVAELLCRLRSDGLAIGLVEHDLGLVERVSDRVAVLNLGSVIAEGTYDEVMALPSVREAYLGGPS